MSKPLTCDRCRRPTEKIVIRLFITPSGKNGSRWPDHSEYTGRADIGECCAKGILREINWTKRKKYQPKEKGAKL